MATFFFDTSALLKRYVDERGTPWVRATCHPVSGHTILVSRLTMVELVSGLAKDLRIGTLDEAQFLHLSSLVVRDTTQDYQQQLMHGSVYALASQLLTTYARDGLRSFDAMQLACAIQANRRLLRAGQPTLTMVVADTILRLVAERSGLSTLDPTSFS